jgi:hypothetical protein
MEISSNGTILIADRSNIYEYDLDSFQAIQTYELDKSDNMVVNIEVNTHAVAA